MKATMERIEKNQVELAVEVEAEEVDQALQKAYLKLVKKYTIPGFRKGKAPRKILETYLGKEPFYSEAMDMVVPKAYSEAVEETSIEPIDQPQLELVQMEAGQPLIFKARVEVKPEVVLGGYRDLPVEQQVAEIKDDDVENYLKNMQQRYAKLISIPDEPAAEGDLLQIDFTGFIDGVPFAGGSGENKSLQLGSNTFIPGFEAQLVGVMADEEREIKVTFPEDYPTEEIAGREAVFRVKVHEIKRKELSPLDDEFAKDVSEWETMDELKTDVRNKLQVSAEKQAEQEAKNKLIQQVMAGAEVEIPPLMVERRLAGMMAEFERSLAMQGINLSQYFELTGETEADLRDSLREGAANDVKKQLVLEAVAKQENLQVAENELDIEVNRLSEMYGQKPETMKAMLASQGDLESIKFGLLLDKTVDYLYAEARITEVTATEATAEVGQEEELVTEG